MNRWEVRANRLLAAQEHVVSAAQVLRCGGSRSGVQAKVDGSAWTKVAPGVYCPAGMEGGWLQRLWIAHLAAGCDSVVSYESAAQLHGLRPVRLEVVNLTVPPGAHPRLRGARFTEASDLLPTHVTRRDGLPVTTPARTLVDLAGRREVTAARLDALVVAAHRERRASVEEFAKVAGEVRRRGKRGMAKVDAILAARAPGASVPASVLEELLFEVIGLAGLGRQVVYQHPLPSDGPAIGYVDAAFPDAKLILEADGRRWHSQEQDMERDRDRDNRAATLGWQTMRFMHRQLRADPAGVAAQVRATYCQRLSPPSTRQACG